MLLFISVDLIHWRLVTTHLQQLYHAIQTRFFVFSIKRWILDFEGQKINIQCLFAVRYLSAKGFMSVKNRKNLRNFTKFNH